MRLTYFGTPAPTQCCGKTLKLRVLKSAAGFYFGTWCPECGPVARESVDYYATEANAQSAMESYEQYNMAQLN